MTNLSAASRDRVLTLPPRPLHPQADAHLPAGRVLLVEDETVISLDLQRILREAGYRIVGPAGSVGEAQVLAARAPLDGAVIDADSAAGWPAADFMEALGVPFVLIGTNPAAIPARHDSAVFIEKPYADSRLVDALERAGAQRRAVPPRMGATIAFPRVWPQL